MIVSSDDLSQAIANKYSSAKRAPVTLNKKQPGEVNSDLKQVQNQEGDVTGGVSSYASGKYHIKDFKIPKMPEPDQMPIASPKKLVSPVRSYMKEKFKIYSSQIIETERDHHTESQLYIGRHKKSKTTHLGGTESQVTLPPMIHGLDKNSSSPFMRADFSKVKILGLKEETQVDNRRFFLHKNDRGDSSPSPSALKVQEQVRGVSNLSKAPRIHHDLDSIFDTKMQYHR